jgi:dihydroorotate dehydrogenase (NAD+) catalytic subunit
MEALKVNLGSINLSNPIIPASGTFGYGKEASDFFDIEMLGAVLTKSITLEPRTGNPQPRIFETASGMMNSIGLENKGYTYFVDSIYPFLTKLKTSRWVSIAGSSPEEYFTLAEKMDSLSLDAIEVNVSCPNVRGGGVQFCQNHEMLSAVVSGIRKRTQKPIFIKISLETNQIKETARLIQHLGADGICVGNTVKGLAISLKTMKPHFANTFAGLSGPAIKPIALRAVWEVYQATPNLPIIGCGGISSSRDVLEFMLAGATAVEIGSANMVNPLLMKEIIEDLQKYCLDHITLKSLIGKAHGKEQ